MTIDCSLSYPGLPNRFFQQRKDTFDKPLIGATVHYHVNRLLTTWPDAKFIHIVRDPRGVNELVWLRDVLAMSGQVLTAG